jgi:hypothetical protein
MANDAVTAFHGLDPETTDFVIACRAADYMIAEHGQVEQLVTFVARATPGVPVPANLEGWQIDPPYDTPVVRRWMIDVLLAGHSISVWYDDDGEEPTLNLGTLAVIGDGARRKQWESPR